MILLLVLEGFSGFSKTLHTLYIVTVDIILIHDNGFEFCTGLAKLDRCISEEDAL
jgi:hypothetical protein